VDDEDVAVRMPGNRLAHAVPEQPLDDPGLARPYHDQVGALLTGKLDDRVGRLADRRHELCLDLPLCSMLRASASSWLCSATESTGSIGPAVRPTPMSSGVTLVTINFDPNACASSAARSRARFAGSVSSKPRMMVFIFLSVAPVR
jgi:hypothetical protein